MKGKLIKILYFSTVVAMMVGCVELDQANPNVRTEDNFWQTEQHLLEGVTAAYDQLQTGIYDDGIRTFSFVMSDEGTQEFPYELRAVCTFEVADYETGTGIWGSLYTLIGRSYQVIENSAGIPGPEVNRIVAEAKFLVALGYYHLIGYFGENVPYVDRVQQATDRPRSAETGEIWMLIEELLTEAIEPLPLADQIATSEYGRASKGAAQTLLAKIHLMQGEYLEAEVLLRAVIESNQYVLNAEYEDNFRELGNVNPESIFQTNFLHNGIAMENDDSRFFRYNSPVEGFELFGDIQTTNFVVDEFLEETDVNGDRDPRMDATVFWDGSDRLFYGLSHSAWIAQSGNVGNPDILNSLYKYSEQDEVLSNEPPGIAQDKDGGTDFIVFRYADVLLLYSEVLNQLGTGNKYDYVDQVRQRANMTPLSVSQPGLDQAAFLEQIKHERVVELTGEMVRHYDLIRWGDYNQSNSVNDPNFETFDSGRDELWPIPQTELDLNPNLLQNPGY